MIRPFPLVPGHLFARLSADIEGLRGSRRPVECDGDEARPRAMGLQAADLDQVEHLDLDKARGAGFKGILRLLRLLLRICTPRNLSSVHSEKKPGCGGLPYCPYSSKFQAPFFAHLGRIARAKVLPGTEAWSSAAARPEHMRRVVLLSGTSQDKEKKSAWWLRDLSASWLSKV